MQLQEEEQRQQQQQARINQRRQAGAQPPLHGATSGRPVHRPSHPTQESQHRSNGVSYMLRLQISPADCSLTFTTVTRTCD